MSLEEAKRGNGTREVTFILLAGKRCSSPMHSTVERTEGGVGEVRELMGAMLED